MKVLKCNSREMGVMEFLYCFKLLSFVQCQLLKKPAHDSLFMEKYARDKEQLGANPLNRQVVKLISLSFVRCTSGNAWETFHLSN